MDAEANKGKKDADSCQFNFCEQFWLRNTERKYILKPWYPFPLKPILIPPPFGLCWMWFFFLCLRNYIRYGSWKTQHIHIGIWLKVLASSSSREGQTNRKKASRVDGFWLWFFLSARAVTGMRDSHAKSEDGICGGEREIEKKKSESKSQGRWDHQRHKIHTETKTNPSRDHIQWSNV